MRGWAIGCSSRGNDQTLRTRTGPERERRERREREREREGRCMVVCVCVGGAWCGVGVVSDCERS